MSEIYLQLIVDEQRDTITRLQAKAAALERERDVSNTATQQLHESWYSAPLEKVLDAFAFQGAMTKVLSDENDMLHSLTRTLVDALKASRDLLVGCQKYMGKVPGQGCYSSTMTQEEKNIADGIASIDTILAQHALAQAEAQGVCMCDPNSDPYTWLKEKLTWTSTKPSKPGFWWWNKGHEQVVVEIYEVAGVLYVDSTDEMKQIQLSKLDGQWAGPIPVPR